MSDADDEITAMLRSALRPYIERLRDPEIVNATDARTAASIIKTLLENCENDSSPGPCNEIGLSRREILETLRDVAAQHYNGDSAVREEDRRISPGEDGLS